MKKNIIIYTVVLLFFSSILLFCEKLDEESLYDYFSGKYRLIGKKVNSNETYTGEIYLITKKSYLKIKRIINGFETNGIGKIEYSIYENIPVLKIKFKENGIEYEGEFIWFSDFDNYPRISGFIKIKGSETNTPGLEAFFVMIEDH